MIHGKNLAPLRVVGARHGVIRQHRGLRQLERTPRDVAGAIALTVVATAAWVIVLPAVAELWRKMFVIANEWLGIGGTVADGAVIRPGWVDTLLPRVEVAANTPSGLALMVTVVICALALVLTLRMPPRLLPLSYFIRAVVIVQLSAVAFFALNPGEALPNVADASLLAGAVIIGLVPLLFGATLCLFDPTLRRGAVAMAVSMAHLAILVPLKYLLQVVLVQESAQLLTPVCFLGLGPALDVMVVVAFYGVAMGRQTVKKAPHPAGIS